MKLPEINALLSLQETIKKNEAARSNDAIRQKLESENVILRENLQKCNDLLYKIAIGTWTDANTIQRRAYDLLIETRYRREH